MSHTTFYVQECPTCGRRLQIRVAYLGRRLFCQHCGGPFSACDPSSGPAPLDPSPAHLLERAEQLLAFAARQRPTPLEDEFLGDAAPVG
ncbi:MAG: transposase [Planctomycetes bacterium]|nr:transposase [Planctomycetota bacterium]